MFFLNFNEFLFFFFRFSHISEGFELFHWIPAEPTPPSSVRLVQFWQTMQIHICWAHVVCPIRFKPQNLLIQLNKKQVQIPEAPKILGKHDKSKQLDVRIVISISPPLMPESGDFQDSWLQISWIYFGQQGQIWICCIYFAA